MALAALQPLGLGLAAVSSGLPMLAGLVLVTAAIYGQVVVNDAMVARYIPAAYRAKAFGLRYFLGFTTSGLAVPLIGLLHGSGGIRFVLAVAGLFGAAIFASAVMFYFATRSGPTRALAPRRVIFQLGFGSPASGKWRFPIISQNGKVQLNQAG